MQKMLIYLKNNIKPGIKIKKRFFDAEPLKYLNFNLNIVEHIYLFRKGRSIHGQIFTVKEITEKKCLQ